MNLMWTSFSILCEMVNMLAESGTQNMYHSSPMKFNFNYLQIVKLILALMVSYVMVTDKHCSKDIWGLTNLIILSTM